MYGCRAVLIRELESNSKHRHQATPQTLNGIFRQLRLSLTARSSNALDVERVRNDVRQSRVQSSRCVMFPKDERVTIGAWISALNFKATQQDIFQKRAPGTGQWLLESREFNAWLVGSSEFLWCRGIRELPSLS
jgi:hypothetical protein